MHYNLLALVLIKRCLGNIIEANGGDIRLNADLAPLRQPDMVFFDKLKQQGRITDYATSYDPGGSITLPTGEEETFSFIAVSHNFPLVGQANFVAPSHDLQMQDVVTGNDIAMSSTVFDGLKAHIGSVYRIKTLDGRFVPVTVAAEFQEDGCISRTADYYFTDYS